jgi:DNA helicase II / ATP-dependent DNA helicase PcrA
MHTIQMNPEQTAAVTAEDGPALVLAGAGSGKTRVIIERMTWLVAEKGVDPRHLLALTFTNRAASEMNTRFAQRIGMPRHAARLGTFHSFGLSILRREMESLGRSRTFTIFDDADQKTLMKRLIREIPEKDRDRTPREALAEISRYKQQLEEPPEPEAKGAGRPAMMHRLWQRYHQALERSAAVDFDDLLVLPVRIFEANPDILRKYQQRYRHILIDEYQDTNHAQYRFARALGGEAARIFAVGDEDQSIYSWRGADIRNILDFAADFPEARIFRLEQNYRSSSPILEAANALVAHNINRLGKNLWTAREGGEKARFHLADSGEDEARFIVRDIARRDLPPGRTAVLYRTNAQSRLFEEAFRARGIACRVVGSVAFYSRREIKDILCWLRFLVNPGDDESLRRIINVPPRGIGAGTLKQIEALARLRRQSLEQTLHDAEMDEQVSSRARNALASFLQLADELREASAGAALEKLVEDILNSTGYRQWIEKNAPEDFESRIENIGEFLVSCREFDGSGRHGVLTFLQDLALISGADSYDADVPAVSLMTCHNAKGLEFEHVYIAGLEENLLPYGTEFDYDRDVEEERRLCYVAMTRAGRSLTLTAARCRMLYNRAEEDREVSRFVDEIGQERLAEVVSEGGRGGKKGSAPVPETVSGAGLKTGVRVRHARFGTGVIMYTTGTGAKIRARIRFDTGHVKLLMVKQAPLEILDREKKR